MIINHCRLLVLATELDCCVIPLKNNLKLIQTTDFFYANIDDPYTMVSSWSKFIYNAAYMVDVLLSLPCIGLDNLLQCDE